MLFPWLPDLGRGFLGRLSPQVLPSLGLMRANLLFALVVDIGPPLHPSPVLVATCPVRLVHAFQSQVFLSCFFASPGVPSLSKGFLHSPAPEWTFCLRHSCGPLLSANDFFSAGLTAWLEIFFYLFFVVSKPCMFCYLPLLSLLFRFAIFFSIDGRHPAGWGTFPPYPLVMV